MPPLEPGHLRRCAPASKPPWMLGPVGQAIPCHPSQVWSALPVSRRPAPQALTTQTWTRQAHPIITCRSPANLWAPGSSLFTEPFDKEAPGQSLCQACAGHWEYPGSSPCPPGAHILMQETVGTSEHPRRELSRAGGHWGWGEEARGRGTKSAGGVGWSQSSGHLGPRGKRDQPSEGRAGKAIQVEELHVQTSCGRKGLGEKEQNRGRGGRWRRGSRVRPHSPAGHGEEPALDPGVKGKPLKGSGGEGHDQFTSRTFSGPMV